MLHAQGELQDIQYARKRVGSTNRAAMFLVNPGTYVATHDRETVPEEVLVLRHDGLYVGGVVNQTIEIVTDADPDTHHHYPVTPLGLGGETPLSPLVHVPASVKDAVGSFETELGRVSPVVVHSKVIVLDPLPRAPRADDELVQLRAQASQKNTDNLVPRSPPRQALGRPMRADGAGVQANAPWQRGEPHRPELGRA